METVAQPAPPGRLQSNCYQLWSNAATDRRRSSRLQIYPSDGHEEIVRGARISGFGPAACLRNLEGIRQ